MTTQSVTKDPLKSLETAGQNLLANKQAAVGIAGGSLVAQFIASDVLRKKEIASLGPLKVKA